MSAKNDHQTTTNSSNKDIIFPSTSKGDFLKVIEFPMGRIILSTSPWNITMLGVPDFTWVITPKNSTRAYRFFGRAIMFPSTLNEECRYNGRRGGFSNEEVIAEGYLNPAACVELINGYVASLFEYGVVEGYVGLEPGEVGVELVTPNHAILSRIAHGKVSAQSVAGYAQEQLDALSVSEKSGGYIEYKGESSTHFYRDSVLAAISPQIVELLSMRHGIDLTKYKLID